MDSPADGSNPPASGNPDEPDTSQMKAVPAQPDVVWPEDPFAADGRASEEPAAEAEPQPTSPSIPAWTEPQFGEPSTPPGDQPVRPLDDDPHTTPFPTRAVIPSWPQRTGSDAAVGKTQPPAAAKTVPPAHDNGAEPPEEAVPTTEVADTAPPAQTQPVLDAVAVTPEVEEPPAPAEAEAAPVSAEAPDETEQKEEAGEPAPAEAVEADGAEAVYEPEPRIDEPVSEPDMPAVAAAARAEEPDTEREPEPEPAPAQPPVTVEAEPAASQPAPGPSERERLAAEAAATFAASSSNPPAANPAIPSWAPKLDAPQNADKQVQWPGSSLPSWAPIPGGPAAGEPQRVRISSTSQPAPAPVQQPAPAPVQQPAPPVQPAAQVPPAAAPAQRPPAPAGSTPPAAAPGASAPPKPSSSWEIVPQKTEAKPVNAGPTAEDKSYAEWFAWAKRSGAPASACHAAAQGAFRALSGGQDMATAVKWATVAMASPPGLVGQARQLYCAWFSLGNIDLQLPTPQAHAFATAAIQALDSGADSMVAHQLGLQAAGVTPR
jgi:hypothetical protein